MSNVKLKNSYSKYGLVLVTSLAVLISVVQVRVAKANSTFTATANASAVVLGSIALAKNRDLNFGNGAPSDGAKIVAANDATNSATFTVTGSANAIYTISIPAAPISLANGAATITVDTFTSSLGASGTIGAGGTQNFSVGATRAALSATQALGTYNGTFNVTVTYQ